METDELRAAVTVLRSVRGTRVLRPHHVTSSAFSRIDGSVRSQPPRAAGDRIFVDVHVRCHRDAAVAECYRRQRPDFTR